jgi:hypothetical protein
MTYIFDNTYVLNSNICRDVGDLFAVYDRISGEFVGYKAIAKKLINDQEICSASFPCDPEELTEVERAIAKVTLK